MPVTVIGGTKVYHSASARAQAATYGKAIAAALAWHRAQLRWTGDLAVVVLDADDWRELAALPYPVPHAELTWKLVVMPVGLESYAWFQFRLAEAADRMLLGRRFSDIVAGLRREFPKQLALRRETVGRTLERLERIVPGAADLLADMAGDGVLPRLSPLACDAVAAPGDEVRTSARLVVENRSGAPTRLWIEELIADNAAFEAKLLHFGDDVLPQIIAEAVAAARADEESATVVPPGMIEIVEAQSGAVVDLMDGTSLSFPAKSSRLIVSGNP